MDALSHALILALPGACFITASLLGGISLAPDPGRSVSEATTAWR